MCGRAGENKETESRMGGLRFQGKHLRFFRVEMGNDDISLGGLNYIFCLCVWTLEMDLGNSSLKRAHKGMGRRT